MKLNYIGVELHWLSILFLLSILQWVIMGYLVYNNKDKLFNEIKGFNNRKDKISFIKDHFFWFWNIYPIIFYLFFYYIEIMWSSWYQSLLMIDYNNKIKGLYENIFFISETSHWIDVDFILLFVIFIPISILSAFYLQNKKTNEFEKNKNKIYWWDKRINPNIFLVRNIFLFFNLVLIAYITLIITKIAIFVMSALLINNLNIFPYHPDGYGGLKVFMEISAIIISIYLLRSAIGVVGYLDHGKEQGFSHIAVDTWNFMFIFLGLFFVTASIVKIKSHLNNAYEKYNIDALLSSEIYNKWINQYKVELDQNNLELVSNFSDNIHNFYSIYNFNNFPLDLSLYISPIFTLILPLSLWFLFKSFESHTNNNKQELNSYHTRQRYKRKRNKIA